MSARYDRLRKSLSRRALGTLGKLVTPWVTPMGFSVQ